jgi:hypothetical protein
LNDRLESCSPAGLFSSVPLAHYHPAPHRIISESPNRFYTMGAFILALNIKGAVFPEGLDALSGYLPALIEINASAVHPQLQRLN